MAPTVLSTTLSLVGLQVGSRLLSFGLNQLLLRSTSPQAFGVATIQLDTLMATVLFLIREGIRGAVVRTRSSGDAAASTLQRQSLLIPSLFIVPASLAYLAYFLVFSPTLMPPYFPTSLALYGISTVIELVSEQLYLRTLQDWQTLTSRRVRVEGVAVFVKAIGTLVTVWSVREEDALLAFGIGQLVYSLTIWAGLAYIVPTRQAAPGASKEPAASSSFFGLRRVDGRYFDPAITDLGWALTKQSVVKQLLTEGDKLAVGRFGSSADMGGYAVALNYGSLVARILFQPLEESSRLYFSSLSAASAPAPPAHTEHQSVDTSLTVPIRQSARPSGGPTLATLSSAASYLRLLLLIYTHLALIFWLIAPAYTTPLLHLLLGARWSRTSAAPLLRAYALSLPFMAFNGLTEAFFQSVAPPRWIQRGSAWMCVCAAAFAGTVWATMRWKGMGAEGLIIANSVNLALRTAFSTWFMWTYFDKAVGALRGGKEGKDVLHTLSWRRWMPSTLSLAAFSAAGWACRKSETRWEDAVLVKGAGVRATAKHLAFGAAAGLACLGVVAFSQRAEIRQLLVSMRSKRKEA
ncbi:hypothetical protein Rhopal_006857-T1 [Rhodotorula paludigena]|uniref:Man(5)GlcNAc(2)-PP-dolichol translocation protein RFT1 n=1 Tax=Rhodotorula paludigena TaxID=86838 RepID=A0AAV5GXA8_9BASI|nr:hypothetical protein Rhopal_006857-T1 [Rhodotorula paludigena]